MSQEAEKNKLPFGENAEKPEVNNKDVKKAEDNLEIFGAQSMEEFEPLIELFDKSEKSIEFYIKSVLHNKKPVQRKDCVHTRRATGHIQFDRFGRQYPDFMCSSDDTDEEVRIALESLLQCDTPRVLENMYTSKLNEQPNQGKEKYPRKRYIYFTEALTKKLDACVSEYIDGFEHYDDDIKMEYYKKVLKNDNIIPKLKCMENLIKNMERVNIQRTSYDYYSDAGTAPKVKCDVPDHLLKYLGPIPRHKIKIDSKPKGLTDEEFKEILNANKPKDERRDPLDAYHRYCINDQYFTENF